MFVEEWISNIVWSKLDIIGTLDNWLISTEQIDSGIIKVSAPKLRACDTNGAVLRISDKD